MVDIRHVKKGETLVREGDHSNSMYWVQSGTLRLFKRKGSGFIELGVLHSGEVVGEMSFLDNLPRSASVEALQPCDIIEIPRGKFDEFMNAQPSWMKSLIQTLVKRLRTTSNRVKELEDSSMVYTRDESGKSTKTHEFLSTNEILRLCCSLTLAFSRNAEKTAEGAVKIKAGWLQFYGSQINGVPLAKIQVFMDTMQEGGMIRIDKQKDHVDLYLSSIDALEKFVYWLHEENSKTDEKKLQITIKGLAVMSAILEHGELQNAPAEAENFTVDMNKILIKASAATGSKLPFDIMGYDELVKSGLGQEMRATGDEKPAVIFHSKIQKLYPFLYVRQRFAEINEKKRLGP